MCSSSQWISDPVNVVSWHVGIYALGSLSANSFTWSSYSMVSRVISEGFSSHTLTPTSPRRVWKCSESVTDAKPNLSSAC